MVGTDAVRICFRKRSRGMALILLFIALGVMPTQAEAKSYTELDDGVYTITNVIADKSLDVAGGYCVNGSNVQVYEGNHTYAQAWRISKKGSSYSIENSITGMVLDVAGGSKIAGANAQLYDSNNTQAQRWKFVQNADGSYSIRSDCNGLFLDVSGGSSKNGANVCLYTSNGTKAQKWRVERVTQPVKDGSYRISTALSDKKMIDLWGGSLDNGAAVQIYEDNDSLAQAWNVVFDQNTGYYSIFSALSGRSFDIPGGSKSSGVRIQQYSSNRTPAQQWRLLQTSDGHIEVVSALTGKALDVPGASLSNGNQLQMYQANHTDAQKWTFNTSPVDHSGSFQL
ncbi:RICIN domain-containing protein [Collinsella aerofaciens]|uniref:RICIN domain-containing protein n=1 Tax=Collinsella aerofaciens TaxID=74426 RepID=UPI003569AD78